jgi:hypothetical protein
MNILLFCIGNPTPIFETELELIRKHEKSGDNVRVLQCTGNLTNCHWNQEHSRSLCAKCRSKFKNGWNILNPGKKVELRIFPAITFAVSDVKSDFNSVDEIKHYQYDNENIGRGVASSLVSIFRDHRFDTNKYRDNVNRDMTTAVQVYKTLKQTYEEFQPDRVYIFNGRITTQLPAVLICERQSIEYVCYEVANTPNRYLLRRNSTSHSIPAMREEMDLLWKAGGAERDKKARLYFEQKRGGVDIDKMSSFTKYQAKSRLPDGFDQKKINIAIFNSTLDEYVAVAGWENPIYEPDETAGIRRILEAFKDDDRYMFYLRVHPHMKKVSEDTSQLQDIRELVPQFSNLHVIWPADIVDSYALMDACNKVITFGSTIGIEAAYWGKPSILAGRALYEHFDGIYVPKTHEELIKLVKVNLTPRSADSVLKFGFREISHGIPFEYFKETGLKKGLATGTFDGVEIKPDVLPALWYQVHFFFWRGKRVLLEPSLLLIKLRELC